MKTRYHHASIAAASLVLAVTLFAACPPDGKNPEPLPTAEFPRARVELETMILDGDTVGMRKHAWHLWSMLTANARCAPQPRWRTWWPASATLEDSAATFHFEAPRIFTADDPDHEELGPDGLPIAPLPPRLPGPPLVVVNVLFNDVAHEWIRDHSLNTVAGLTTLHDGFASGAVPIEQRQVPEFRFGAVALKTVWVLIRSEGMDLPVWKPDTERKGITGDERGYPPEHWATKIRVITHAVPADAAAAAPAPTIADPAAGSTPSPYNTINVDRFYNIPLDSQRLVDSINVSLGLTDDEKTKIGARVGDVAVLVGMHVATKELPDWVWATFWWHPEPDSGDFAAERPDTVKGVWRNYLMDVALDPMTPRECDGRPNACFNPWLEAKLNGNGGGVNSNCASCHARARWHPTKYYSPTFFKQGRVPMTNEIFADTVRLDYVWSLSKPRK